MFIFLYGTGGGGQRTVVFNQADRCDGHMKEVFNMIGGVIWYDRRMQERPIVYLYETDGRHGPNEGVMISCHWLNH